LKAIVIKMKFLRIRNNHIRNVQFSRNALQATISYATIVP